VRRHLPFAELVAEGILFPVSRFCSGVSWVAWY
jgi:hypothetical protein